MSRLAQYIKTERETEKKRQDDARAAQDQAKADANPDKRSNASKVFDTVNLWDSGRSLSTATPSKAGAKKGIREQSDDIVKSLFSGTEKVVDSVEALTGVAEKRSNNRMDEHNRKMQAINDKYADVPDGDPRLQEMYKEKKQLSEKLSGELDAEQEDTKWAGTEDKGFGDRLTKSAGVALEATSELIPIPVGKAVKGGSVVAKGAKAGLKEGAEQVVKKGAKEAAEAAVRPSKLSKFIQASKVGGATSAVGSTGGQMSEEGGKVDLGQVAADTLFGAVTSGATTQVNLRPLDQNGNVLNPFKIKASIGDDLKSQIDRGKINPTIEKANTSDLKLGADTNSDALDPLAVEDYRNKIKRGDTIDPIVVTKGSDGLDYIEDGAHRLAAAQELGIREIPIVRKMNNIPLADKLEPPTVENLSVTTPNKTMAAAVDGGSDTLVAPVQLRVLDNLQKEADYRTPGGIDVPASQKTATRTQQGAQYIVDDIEKINDEIGLELAPLDRRVAGALTGDGSTAVVRRGWKQQTGNHFGKNFQDSMTYAAKTVGRPGVELVQDMLGGHKFKRDALDGMRDDMVGLAKLNKKLTPIQKRDIGARVGAALDDRANADSYLKTPQEREMFDHYQKIFDFVKVQREKAGLETLENYRPWVDMKDAAEPPAWLADGITNKRVQTLSRFSKERTKTDAGENVDNNLADMIYGYVNSQLNEMAYDAPVRKFKTNFDSMAAGNKANEGNLNSGMEYLSTLVKQAVNPSTKDAPERVINKLVSNVYGSVLPFNPKLTFMNKTQQWAANSNVSRGAVRLSKKLDKELKQFEDGLVFGDQSVFGQLEDVNQLPSGKKKGVREKVSNIDPYQRGEKANVNTSFHKGLVQAAMDSTIYKNAVSGGMKKKDAVLEALKDPAVLTTAKQRGNTIVNDTQFGANPLARPGGLRSEAAVLGIPVKAFTMFVRFPIGMSQHILESLKAKDARAMDMLKGGDPRAMSISEMRTNYRSLLDVMKESQESVKKGVDIGVPEDVLKDQIKTVTKNLKIIDGEAKNLSQIRTGKTLKNVAKMWTAAAAIQVIFDAGVQSFADDPVATSGEALYKTNPTATGLVAGANSKLGALTSSASPIDKRGDLNERAITNYIPGVGLAVNRGRDIKKLADSLLGAPEE